VFIPGRQQEVPWRLLMNYYDVLTFFGVVVMSMGIGFTIGIHVAKRIVRKMFIESLGITPEEYMKVQEEIDR
jgi:hypothetical protein